ncbi:hypothetical protein HGG75_17660 [Ochrobactrum pseudogrignonense]|nr:hypothetical protein [Brucella pseudogrignonensis]
MVSEWKRGGASHLTGAGNPSQTASSCQLHLHPGLILIDVVQVGAESIPRSRQLMAALVEIEIDPLALKQAHHGKAAICRNRLCHRAAKPLHLKDDPPA